MRTELFALCVAVAVLVALASCGMSSSDDSDLTGTSSWPSCSWPASLDPGPTGSARDHCVATRTRLSCAVPGGVTQICSTNDPTRCESAGAPPPESCHAECARDEFAVMCGGVGPGSIPAPPAGCSRGVPTPAGMVFYCCPCA